MYKRLEKDVTILHFALPEVLLEHLHILLTVVEEARMVKGVKLPFVSPFLRPREESPGHLPSPSSQEKPSPFKYAFLDALAADSFAG